MAGPVLFNLFTSRHNLVQTGLDPSIRLNPQDVIVPPFGATNGLFSSSNIFDNLTCHLGQNLFRHHLRWVRLKIEIESTGPATNPNVVIVGLPGTTVKKSRDRVTTAIARGGYFGRAGKGKSMSPWPILKGTTLRLTDCAWHDRGFPCPLVRANFRSCDDDSCKVAFTFTRAADGRFVII